MKSTGKKLFIRNKNRNVYLKNGKYYYRDCNEYHLIKRRLIGGAGDAPAAETAGDAPAAETAGDAPAGDAPAAAAPAAGDAAGDAPAAAAPAAAKVEEPKADQEDIDKFIGDKKITYKKIKLFENVVKYYKHYLGISILDKIKNSLNFLTKYNDKINVIIDMFKHDDNGQLSSEQVRMLITYLKKFIFDKIFVNYFIDIISIYYDNSRSAKKEIENAMHMLTFVENDRKEELIYSQKINNLLKRLIDYGTINANEREKAYVDFSIKLAALKDGKTDDGEEEENNGEYNNMTATKFAEVKPDVLIDLKAKFEKQELILIEIQGTFYWWDKMRTIVEKEFKETDNKYIKAFEIFINELLRETIYYDIELEEKIEEKKQEEEKLDPELYEIYRKFIRNTFIKKMKNGDVDRHMIDGTLSDSEYNKRLDEIEIDKVTGREPTLGEEGLKRHFIRQLDKSIKKRKDEKRKTITGLIETRQANMIPGFGMSTGTVTGGQAGELLKAQTEMEDEEKKLVKMKKILKEKVLKYIEILNIMATASEQKELTDSNGDNEGETIVNKQSFKDMASILIVYLKQHILSFSIVYKQIIRDIKNVHKTLLEEIEELEKKIEEYKSE